MFVRGDHNRASLSETPLFDPKMERVYFIDDAEVASIDSLFDKMEEVIHSDYSGKADELRCYLHLLIHEAMRVKAISSYEPHNNAAKRIAELFLALLDRQFRGRAKHDRPSGFGGDYLEIAVPAGYAIFAGEYEEFRRDKQKHYQPEDKIQQSSGCSVAGEDCRRQ